MPGQEILALVLVLKLKFGWDGNVTACAGQ